jgi:two-component system CheB/CheR fusion protein
MAKTKQRSPAETGSPFPIVGVGASAGGLDAFMQLLRALPADPGFAIVYVLHHDGRRESALSEVLQRATQMQVVRVDPAREIELACDHVYVADGGANLTMAGGRLLSVKARRGEGPLPIDTFLLSLAKDQRSRAVGVILSGSASDGAIGMSMIKSEGGITFTQDDTAQFKSMPESAREATTIDYTLSPPEIAEELVDIARSGHFSCDPEQPAHLPEKELHRVFAILKASHDVDFTHYKPSTVERRIRRRMALLRIGKLSDYADLVKSNANEAALLYSDILIRVTAFFRDPDVFSALRALARELLRERAEDDPVRVWVPGCATGEEVYSIAMVMIEAMEESKVRTRLQVFGTDVSEAAVERARLGVYPEAAVAGLPPERAGRFFSKFDGGFRLAKAVRDCCIFARQNITKDPPFSRLDLISCRNVMIYLDSDLQRRVMAIFHYALRPNGFLLLGSSETTGKYGDLFAAYDRKHKIYQKKLALNRPVVEFHGVSSREPVEKIGLERELAVPPNVFREADRLLLTRFAPPGVVINKNMEILQFRGRTSRFLEPAPGVATFNVLKMAREGLLADLRAAIHTAKKTDGPVRREGVRLVTDGEATTVSLEVIPFVTPAQEPCQIILFEEEPVAASRKKGRAKKKEKEKPEEKDTRNLARLKGELAAMREYLQSTIEEQEAMNEELRSANEEIQSSNEELITLNEELENRNEELGVVNNDLANLLASVDAPIIILDADLRIRRFNSGAQRVLKLIPTDVGRSIDDVKATFNLKELEELVHEVLENLETRETEVQDREGRWFTLRVKPYKTADKKVDGAVLVVIDITHLKKR